MKIIEYSAADYSTLRSLIINNRFPQKTIFNFLNLYGVWLINNNETFRNSIFYMKQHSKNFIDSGVISLILRCKQFRGPSLTRNLLNDEEVLKNKTHFFLGFSDRELDQICKELKYLGCEI